jgi:uncharacterized OsmC-like protein
MVTIKSRPIAVSASLPGQGQGRIAAESGASVRLAHMAAEEGFTPLELLDAALAGCLVLSARIAARKFGWTDRLLAVDVTITHEKAHDLPSRVTSFASQFTIAGDFTDAERTQLIEEAHNLCTVGNTLAHGANVHDID